MSDTELILTNGSRYVRLHGEWFQHPHGAGWRNRVLPHTADILEELAIARTELARVREDAALTVEALTIAADLLTHAVTSEDGIDASDAAEGVKVIRAAIDAARHPGGADA